MTETPTPDSSRRDGIPVRPIRLADGRDWGFSRPTARLSPAVHAGQDRLGRPVERISVATGFGYPLEISRMIEAVRAACDRGSIAQQYEAFFFLASSLLRRAHEIDMATACELLSVSEGELSLLVREVMAVVNEVESTTAPGRVETSTDGEQKP